MKLQWILPNNYKPERPNVILAHGFAADARDMQGLAQSQPELFTSFNWFFPQAPLEVKLGYFAWFPSDRSQLQRVMDGDFFHELGSSSLPEIEERCSDLLDDIQELQEEYENFTWKTTVLGGFSQGSVMALRSVLELGRRVGRGRIHKMPQGLVLLSTMLMDRAATEAALAQCPAIPTFQSHGRQDSVAPAYSAENLLDMLQSASWHVKYHKYDGAHTVPAEVCTKLLEFLEKVFG